MVYDYDALKFPDEYFPLSELYKETDTCPSKPLIEPED